MLRPEDCKPGTLVECIDANHETGTPFIIDNPTTSDMDGLCQGSIYTIRWAGEIHDKIYYPFFGIRLVEIIRMQNDMAYLASRFRLLPDERLAVFRAMLAPKPVKQLEPTR